MLKVLLFSFLALAAPEQKTHSHGAGEVNIAFDGLRGKITMEVPGEALFGFEHEAKSKQDRETKEAALKKLEEKISEMIVFAPEAQCKIKKDIFEVSQERNHSDFAADFNVVCQKSIAGTTIFFHFQKFFKRLKRVKIKVIADSEVQKAVEVSRDGERLELK